MKKLWKKAKLLTFFAIISVVICALKIIFIDANEWCHYVEVCFTFVYDIALAYIASYIFYILQVYLPECSKEKEIIPIRVMVHRNVQVFTVQLVILCESFYKNSIKDDSGFKRKKIWTPKKMLEATKGIKLFEDSDAEDLFHKKLIWKDKISTACHELIDKGNRILNYKLNFLPAEVVFAINYLISESAMLGRLSISIDTLEKLGCLEEEDTLYDILPIDIDINADEKHNIIPDIKDICLLIEWVNQEYDYIMAESKGRYKKYIYNINFS